MHSCRLVCPWYKMDSDFWWHSIFHTDFVRDRLSQNYLKVGIQISERSAHRSGMTATYQTPHFLKTSQHAWLVLQRDLGALTRFHSCGNHVLPTMFQTSSPASNSSSSLLIKRQTIDFKKRSMQNSGSGGEPRVDLDTHHCSTLKIHNFNHWCPKNVFEDKLRIYYWLPIRFNRNIITSLLEQFWCR